MLRLASYTLFLWAVLLSFSSKRGHVMGQHTLIGCKCDKFCSIIRSLRDVHAYEIEGNKGFLAVFQGKSF